MQSRGERRNFGRGLGHVDTATDETEKVQATIKGRRESLNVLHGLPGARVQRADDKAMMLVAETLERARPVVAAFLFAALGCLIFLCSYSTNQCQDRMTARPFVIRNPNL